MWLQHACVVWGLCACCTTRVRLTQLLRVIQVARACGASPCGWPWTKMRQGVTALESRHMLLRHPLNEARAYVHSLYTALSITVSGGGIHTQPGWCVWLGGLGSMREWLPWPAFLLLLSKTLYRIGVTPAPCTVVWLSPALLCC